MEEGLDTVVLKRLVPTLTATLSLKGEDLKNSNGYMAPLPEEELLSEEKFKKEVDYH